MWPRFGLCMGVVGGMASMLSTLDAQPVPPIEGLWSYQAIASSGGAEVPIRGFFVFRDGRFVQQTLNVGEPFDKQVAQAHAGTYVIEGQMLRLTADVGFVISPQKPTPVDPRSGSKHELKINRSGTSMTLTFDTGTVQKLTLAGPADGRIYPLREGALALVDGRFVLAASAEGRAVAGSGSFERAGSTLTLKPERWFSIRDGVPTYVRAPVVATFDEQTLSIPGQPVLPVKK